MERWMVLSAMLLGLLFGCGDDEPGTPAVVSVLPEAAAVALGETYPFSAAVTGPSDHAVTWSVDGGAPNGTISVGGLYTAPGSMPASSTVTVRATSHADAGKSATAAVTLIPEIVVTVSPASPSLYVNHTQQFTATVEGVYDGTVTWSLDYSFGGRGGITSSGLYTAPTVVPNPSPVIVRATSPYDITRIGTALVTVLPPEVVPAGFVRIPAGSFRMGDGVGVASCGSDQRDVTLTSAFYIGQMEVANQQFLNMVQWAYDQGYVAVDDSVLYDRLDGRTGTEIALMGMNQFGADIGFADGTFVLRHADWPVSGAFPVKVITWYGAAAYCDWLSLHEGLPRAYNHVDWSCNGGDPCAAEGYRLPTDAEWEYATQCRGERIYPWGDTAPTCSEANWWNQPIGCVGWTTPVGSYPTWLFSGGNPIYDMAGNVWEWCNDWHVCRLGTAAIQDPPGPATGTERVVRGGSWAQGADYLRCAYRHHLPPVSQARFGGFRVVRTAAP